MAKLTYQKDLISRLGNILILSEVVYNQKLAHNAVVNAYLGEDWLGSYQKGFTGAWDKVSACFTEDRPIYFVLFDLENQDPLLLKEKLRVQAGVGKHSIHITDTCSETKKKANIFFCSGFKNWAVRTKLNAGKRFISCDGLIKEMLENDVTEKDPGHKGCLHGIIFI